MSDDPLDKYDPRVQAALREHFTWLLGEEKDGQGLSAMFFVGALMQACELPEETRRRVRAAVEREREARHRDLSPAREMTPTGPHADPATCQHAWEPHLWEQGQQYCPYCTSVREKP